MEEAKEKPRESKGFPTNGQNVGRGIFAENLLNQIPAFSHVEEGGKRSSFLHFRASVRNNENKERLDKKWAKKGPKELSLLFRGPGPCCIRTKRGLPLFIKNYDGESLQWWLLCLEGYAAAAAEPPSLPCAHTLPPISPWEMPASFVRACVAAGKEIGGEGGALQGNKRRDEDEAR